MSGKGKELPDYRWLVIYPCPDDYCSFHTSWFKEHEGMAALELAAIHGVVPYELCRMDRSQAVPRQVPSSGEKSRDQIRVERAAFYGDAGHNHYTIGMMWTGLMEQFYSSKVPKFKLPFPIPGELVAMFQAMIKFNRQAFRRKRDNVDDAHNYIDIAEECADKERP